jgi:hypothetical protein
MFMLPYVGLAAIVGVVIFLFRLAGKYDERAAWERYYASKPDHSNGDEKIHSRGGTRSI